MSADCSTRRLCVGDDAPDTTRLPAALGPTGFVSLFVLGAWALLLIVSSSTAQAYGVYDLRRIITNTATAPANQPAAGAKGNTKNRTSQLQEARESTAGIDLEYLDLILNDLARQALYYPPAFADDAERQRATNDVQALIRALRPLTSRKYPPSAALLRSGLLHLLAWNLDIPGTQATAFSHLQLYLKRVPADAYANFLLGVCYAGSASQQSAALPYLGRAAAGGVNQAYYTLALVYFSMGDRARALDNLQLYRQAFPDDTDVLKVIQAIQSGDVQVERAYDGQAPGPDDAGANTTFGIPTR